MEQPGVYSAIAIVEAQGHAGGIWLLSCGNFFSATIFDMFPQAVTVEFSSGSKNWICSAIYASPIPNMRTMLWDHLIILRNSINIP